MRNANFSTALTPQLQGQQKRAHRRHCILRPVGGWGTRREQEGARLSASAPLGSIRFDILKVLFIDNTATATASLDLWEMMRFQFRLSAFLIFVTAVAVFFGYSQWRRQQILKDCYELSLYEVAVVLPESWVDRYLWQCKPYGAVIRAGQHSFEMAKPASVYLRRLGIEKRSVAASDSKWELAVEEVRNGRAWLPTDEYYKTRRASPK